MRTLGLLSLLVLTLVASDGIRARTLCEGFLPKNNLKIPVGDINALGLDEGAFNKVLDRAEAVYGPIIAAKGAKLVVNRLWDDPTVNASAEQSGKTWTINMYGGLARHKLVTTDGFALVACHELGHHLGGYPKYAGDEWATNEGGADYFATLKCMRLVLGKPLAAVDPVAKQGCARAYPNVALRGLCEYGAMAGVSVSSLLAELGGSPMPSLATPDASVVDQTNDAHPAAQCRLDTYFQAALCGKPVSEAQSNTEPNAGACTAAGGFKEGLRPLCWYKPPTPPNAALVNARLEELSGAMSGRGI